MGDTIDTVCFIGAGTMGCFNSLMAAVAGYKAVVFDVSEEALASAQQSTWELAGFLVSQGFFTEDAIPDAIANISYTSNMTAAVQQAQLVSESVSEKLDLKRKVHAELDRLCSSETLITTNTSGFVVSEIEDVLHHGERFAALHSHLGSSLFDIVAGPRTSAETVERLRRYVESVSGKALILKKEYPGYVLNAMLGPLLTVAKVMVIKGKAGIEDVDRAWMASQNASIGPFGLIDLFGLNVIHDSWQKPKAVAADLQQAVLQFVGSYIEAGKLGAKAGEGFYRYPEPAYTDANFLSTETHSTNAENALVTALIGSALKIAEAGVADAEQINEAWCFSLNLERGPFDLLEHATPASLAEGQAELAALGLAPAEP